jgi:hypothetical protein
MGAILASRAGMHIFVTEPNTEETVKYALLIYTDPSIDANRSAEEMQAIYEKYGALSAEVSQRGIARGGEELEGVKSARTVRVRDGEVLVTDGPYVETKEYLGGFYLLECASPEEALEYAAKIPSAAYGSIEVRPVAE